MSTYIANKTENCKQNNFTNQQNNKDYDTNRTDNNKLISFNQPAQIQISTQYSLFKPHPLQRNIEPRNLDRIRESIEQHNLLHENPIHVTASLDPSCSYWVFDGNHR